MAPLAALFRWIGDWCNQNRKYMSASKITCQAGCFVSLARMLWSTIADGIPPPSRPACRCRPQAIGLQAIDQLCNSCASQRLMSCRQQCARGKAALFQLIQQKQASPSLFERVHAPLVGASIPRILVHDGNRRLRRDAAVVPAALDLDEAVVTKQLRP